MERFTQGLHEYIYCKGCKVKENSKNNNNNVKHLTFINDLVELKIRRNVYQVSKTFLKLF